MDQVTSLTDLPIDCIRHVIKNLNDNEKQIFRYVSSKFIKTIPRDALLFSQSMPLKVLQSEFAKYPLTRNVFATIALSGNLENMKWLKEAGYLWDTCTFKNAAQAGNLENMKWLKENDCPWNEYTFKAAAKIGNLDNMKWLKEHGCPVPDESDDCE